MLYEILYMLLLIGLNILINYLYRENILFPIIFMLFEIVYGISIISANEIYVLFTLVFSVSYNLLIVNEIKKE